MTDRPESSDVSSGDSPEIAEVRRLLAEARHDEPMPDDVATRMDDVLAGLTPRPRRDDVVVPIAAHRRRRVAGLLVAAAAIVVGGVTIAPHLKSTGSGPSGSAGSTAQDSAGGNTDLGNTGNSSEQPETAPVPTKGADSLQVKNGVVVVRPRHFSADARQGRAYAQRNLPALRSASKVACPDVPGPGRQVAAEYQHAPAVLVYRRAQGNTQVVDLYVCGNDRAVRSTTLPVP